MKKLLSLLSVLLLAVAGINAQSPAPGILNYQGVARNSVGNVLVNKNITLRLTIHDGSAAGPVVYSETRPVTTNPFGLFNVQLGSTGATVVSGSIAGVPWGVGLKYIQVEIDPNGGSTFINIGTAQLASVPYSLYSSLSNDLVLPFNKTQADAGTLFRVTNSGTGSGSTALEGVTNSQAGNASAVIGTVSHSAPGGFSAGVRGINNGAAGLGIGVYGSQAGSGWGVYGTTPTGIGVHGQSASGFGVYGLSTSGVGVYGNSSTGNSGRFEITNAANNTDALSASTNGGAASWAIRASSTGSQGAGIFSYTGPAAANSLRVLTSGTGFAANITSSNAAPLALRTQGGLQLTGIGEAANRLLTSDAVGNATWQTAAAVGVVTGSGTLNFVPKWTPVGTNLGNSQIFDDGSLVGINTALPTHKLTVLHGGSTGIAVRSTSSFSTVDIDAASGDAALRFYNLGSGMWNMRNRPGDNYLEFFELGGGGSRMAIQDGTGNVGIGNTTAAISYRLHVEHGGSTGILSRSTSSFSVVDIDAASGDAALRFQKAGVGQWNTRNRPADDYYEIFELGGGGSRVVIQDGTGNVGIGETTNPTYKLDVLHGGSTGIRSRSSGSFSVVDIDAASGDAALRFQSAGVGQWNTRNRPADDYYEIFELGGGGSRVVIQDGTGNVGIGETVNPTYKLDVLHGGSTGIRSRSSGSFSVVDIDAASGDAALRFANAGVNQWNIRNQPGTDNLQIFELGGGGERMHIQDATGNVSIGGEPAPSYRLDVLHGGATGTRIRSSASFSVVDIDGNSGDAALRFVKAGVNQWNTRNNPGTDDYQIFELGGGGERLRIENTTGRVVVSGDLHVAGTLSKAAGAFKIDHPMDPENKYLVHSFVESPDMMNIYNGNIVTDGSGKAVVSLPDYFNTLNKDFRYQLTVIGSFAQAIISKEVEGNSFEIATNQPNVKVSWQVTGVRQDPWANKFRIPNVVEKDAADKGKYLNPEAYNLPETKKIRYTPEPAESSLNYAPKATNKPAPATTGGSLAEMPKAPAKTAPATTGGSLDEMPKAPAKEAPASKGGSLDEMPKPAENNKKAEVKGGSTEGE